MIKEIGMKKQCVKCGLHLDKDQKLWCEKCKERVDEELRGEVSRPYEYYFRHHLKQMRKERDLFGQVGEFGSGKTLNRMLRGG